MGDPSGRLKPAGNGERFNAPRAGPAIDKKELMPGRFIRVRTMAEQVADNGDIMATALAMQILGASHVESLDTRGTDGSNIHLAGYLLYRMGVDIARTVPNISAKHESGEPEIEATREHPSDILDYFITREDIEAGGLMAAMEQNYLDKHHAANQTARALIRWDTGVIPVARLHL